MVETLSRIRAPRFVAGVSAQALVRVGGFAVAAITAPLVARHLGPAGYGNFTIVVTVLFFLGMIGEFGLPLLASREWPALTSVERPLWLVSFWDFRHIVTLFTVLLGVAGVLLWPFGSATRWALLIGLVGLAASLTAGGAAGLFTAALDPAPTASFELTTRIAWLVAVGVVILSGLSVIGIMAALAFSQVVGSAVLLWLARRRGIGWRAAGSRARQRTVALARRALPLAPLPVLGVLYARADILILAFQATPAEVGTYGVIWRILELLMTLVGVMAAFFLPMFASCRDDAEQRAIYGRFLRLLTISMVPVAVSVAILARPALLVIGGEDFLQPTRIPGGTILPETSLAAIMGAFALMSIGIVNGSLMLARRLHRQLVRHFLLALGVNVTLALVLIPQLSYLGAALASLGSEVVAATHSTWIVRREMGSLRLGRTLGLSTAASLGIVAVRGPAVVLPARLVLILVVLAVVGRLTVNGGLRELLPSASDPRSTDPLTRHLRRIVGMLDRRGPLRPRSRLAYPAWLTTERLRGSYYRRRAGLYGLPWPPPDPGGVDGPKVNLGNGQNRLPGWINIDIRAVGDVVATAERLPLRSGSASYLKAHDLLEHFWRESTQGLLAEWNRVLDRDGWLELKVPNLLRLGRLLQTEEDLKPFIENIYGGHRWGEGGEFDTHHWGWTPATLERELFAAGFVVVTNDHALNMTVKAVVR